MCRSGNLKASTALGAAKEVAGLLDRAKVQAGHTKQPALRSDSTPISLEAAYAIAEVSMPLGPSLLEQHHWVPIDVSSTHLRANICGAAIMTRSAWHASNVLGLIKPHSVVCQTSGARSSPRPCMSHRQTRGREAPGGAGPGRPNGGRGPQSAAQPQALWMRAGPALHACSAACLRIQTPLQPS